MVKKINFLNIPIDTITMQETLERVEKAIVLNKQKRTIIINKMEEIGIESRPIISGNFINNPVLKYSKYRIGSKMDAVKKIDANGFMIGNRSTLFTLKEKKALIDLQRLLEN